MENKEKTDSVENLIRECILDRANSHFSGQSISLEKIIDENDENIPIYKHWMAVILVSGKTIKIMLMIQFDSEMIRSFLGPMLKVEKTQIDDGKVFDYIKELGNLLAGLIQTHMDKIDVSVGMSLPMLTRGFDILYSDLSTFNTHVKNGKWKCNIGDLGNIVFIFSYEVSDDFDPKGLEFNSGESGTGEVDFL